jgi:hypothetical protein
MTISAHDGPRIKDLWVFSTAKPHTIVANLKVEQTYHMALEDGAGTVEFEVVDPPGHLAQ